MRRFIAYFSYRVISRLVAALLQAAAWAVVARAFGPSDLGAVAVGMSVGTAAAAVLGLGTTTRVLRAQREDSPEEFARAVLRYMVVVSLTVSLVASAVTYSASTHSLVAAAVAGLQVLTNVTSGVVIAKLAGENAQFAASNVGIILRLIPFTLAVASPAGLSPTEGYMVGLISVGSIMLFYSLGRGPRAPFRDLVQGSAGYTLGAASSSLSSLDVVIVKLFSGAMQAGWYGAASRLTLPLSMAVSSLLSIIVPMASSEKSESVRRKMFRRARWAASAGMFVMVASSPVVAWLGVKVLGPQYVPSFPLFVGLTVAVAMSMLSQVLQAELLTEGNAMVAGVAVTTGTLLGLAAMTIGLIATENYLPVAPVLTQLLILLFLLLARSKSRKG